jgi:hypothetical protein
MTKQKEQIGVISIALKKHGVRATSSVMTGTFLILQEIITG